MTGDIKLTLTDNDIISVRNTIDSAPACYGAIIESQSGTLFYRNSDSSATNKVPVPWPVTAPTGWPSNCVWPVDFRVPVSSTNALLPLAIRELGNSTTTTGISYDGNTWNRFIPSTAWHGVRAAVPLTLLTNGRAYVIQWEVANDGLSDIAFEMDWNDGAFGFFTVKPGERKILNMTGARSSYDSIYRFSDLVLQESGGSGLLFRNPIVVPAP